MLTFLAVLVTVSILESALMTSLLVSVDFLNNNASLCKKLPKQSCMVWPFLCNPLTSAFTVLQQTLTADQKKLFKRRFFFLFRFVLTKINESWKYRFRSFIHIASFIAALLSGNDPKQLPQDFKCLYYGIMPLFFQVRLPPEVNRILYVKNLPYKITAEEMYDIFGKYGAIRQIRVWVLNFRLCLYVCVC